MSLLDQLHEALFGIANAWGCPAMGTDSRSYLNMAVDVAKRLRYAESERETRTRNLLMYEMTTATLEIIQLREQAWNLAERLTSMSKSV